jgi:type VI secretion system secreted protein VgrG
MLEISTSAGDGVFIVHRFSGREELGRLFEYNLELLAERSDIPAEKLLGTNATIGLELLDGAGTRYFNGYITRFSVQGVIRSTIFNGETAYVYLVTVSPGSWFMTRASNSRIFSQTTIGNLVLAQFQADGLMTVTNKVGATEMRDYIVQYRETDFNFAGRLAEHAGIYYYFTHDNGSHTMVLLDAVGGHEVNPALADISFSGADVANTTLTGFQLVCEVQSGAYAASGYNYVTPNTQIAAVSSDPKPHDNAGFEMFDHPVDSTTASFAATYAKIRAEELSCRYAVAHGVGTERNLQVGFKTTLKDHFVDALNQQYTVIGHSFTAVNNLLADGGAGASFDCKFEAIPASVQFRPARTLMRPSIPGTQTALVVAEFHTDTDSSGGADPIGANMGRVKVQFFWDRYSKQSCWARVASPWAGKGYGFQNMPRLDEEVLVQFIEGDPDRPVVIGRVYNANNMPPWELPANASITGFKTMSMTASGGSSQGSWSELRFDDKAGSEQVYIQAQKDFDRRILNDEKTWVGNESHNYVKGDTYHKYDGDHHVQTTGDVNEKIGGSNSLTLTKDQQWKIGGNFLTDITGEIHLKSASNKIIIEAGSDKQLSLVVGSSFIDISASAISIKAPMVNVNSGGAAGSGTDAAPIPAKDGKTAMTSAGGSPTSPPPAPTAPTAFSPQATSFKLAAATGAAFVPQCAG